MLANIWHTAEGAVVFLLILLVLVAAHEYGHYVFARLFGMGVEEFSIGMFGKRPLLIWKRKRYRIRVLPGEDPHKRTAPTGFNFEGAGDPMNEPVLLDSPSGQYLEETTQFTIRPWPIGGFVRIKGMMPEEDGSEVRIPGGFYSKSPWKRLAVLLAGPLFSIASGVIVMIPVIAAVGDFRPSNEPVIGHVLPNTPAAKAGMKDGDRILAVDGVPVKTFYDVSAKVRDNAGEKLDFTWSRSGKEYSAIIVPYLSDMPMPVVGPDQQPTGEFRRYALMGVERKFESAPVSLPEAASLAVRIPIQNVRMLVSIFHEPDTAKETVSGPVGMLNMTTAAVQDGIVTVVSLAATISIALGIFNLLPVYPMDGGQMVVAIAELLRGGRRLSLHVQTVIGTVGLSLLALIAIGALTIDIGRSTGKLTTTSSTPGPAKK